jgi:predicted site-specific integrase-resolvase
MDAETNEAVFIKSAEAARLLGVSRSSVSLAIKRGKIPVFRLLSEPLIPRGWVEEKARKTMEAWKQKGGVK